MCFSLFAYHTFSSVQGTLTASVLCTLQIQKIVFGVSYAPLKVCWLHYNILWCALHTSLVFSAHSHCRCTKVSVCHAHRNFFSVPSIYTPPALHLYSFALYIHYNLNTALQCSHSTCTKTSALYSPPATAPPSSAVHLHYSLYTTNRTFKHAVIT